jgi:gamma-glutamyl phosphate reductase
VSRSDVRRIGLRIERQGIPLGVVALIYVARHYVTAEAA